jgi:hypothetical protein
MLIKQITDTWYMARYKRFTFFGSKREIVEARCAAFLRANPQHLQLSAK